MIVTKNSNNSDNNKIYGLYKSDINSVSIVTTKFLSVWIRICFIFNFCNKENYDSIKHPIYALLSFYFIDFLGSLSGRILTNLSIVKNYHIIEKIILPLHYFMMIMCFLTNIFLDDIKFQQLIPGIEKESHLLHIVIFMFSISYASYKEVVQYCFFDDKPEGLDTFVFEHLLLAFSDLLSNHKTKSKIFLIISIIIFAFVMSYTQKIIINKSDFEGRFSIKEVCRKIFSNKAFVYLFLSNMVNDIFINWWVIRISKYTQMLFLWNYKSSITAYELYLHAYDVSKFVVLILFVLRRKDILRLVKNILNINKLTSDQIHYISTYSIIFYSISLILFKDGETDYGMFVAFLSMALHLINKIYFSEKMYIVSSNIISKNDEMAYRFIKDTVSSASDIVGMSGMFGLMNIYEKFNILNIDSRAIESASIFSFNMIAIGLHMILLKKFWPINNIIRF